MSSRTRLAENPVCSPAVAPEFYVSPLMLDAISPAADRGGMVIGSGMNGEPLMVSVLRSSPTRIAVVGGLYLARQLALRAMATGAQVIVVTGRPAAWQVLQQAAGPGPDGQPSQLVQIRRLEASELPRATEDNPILVIHDGGAAPSEIFPPRSPWQTTLYVLPYLHQQAGPILNQADLVLVQRLPVEQTQIAANIWRLNPQMAQQLGQQRDEQVMAMGNDMWMPFRLVTTPAEQKILGPVRRGD
ncbi:hypothetical protein D5S17_30540 [Pseudonocardiaceae bacterium YIM PH 21723]|nr:hypothetical protein D5S17_30540 [Pseudonocardiaceae bacterium YIM PH 21723]